MTWLAKARFFSATVAVVAILSWITGTNHCLLGSMKGAQNGAFSESHCPVHRESGTAHSNSSGMLACCQGLLSPNFQLTKAQFFLLLFVIQRFGPVDSTLPNASGKTPPKTEYDTGPPLASFFVDTVLRRSLPENAPPLLS
jgi:hypothetical protein